jgi:hypothetical protein
MKDDERRLLEASRGIHTRPYNGETNDWITPKWLVDALGPFDLDPCASTKQPWPTATRMLTYHDDGLTQLWDGFVWLNPPYGPNTGEWLARLAQHGDGIALVPARTETGWFQQRVWNAAGSVLFLTPRLRFHRPDGTLPAGNAGHASVLVAFGKRAQIKLQLAPAIRGTLVRRWFALSPQGNPEEGEGAG